MLSSSYPPPGSPQETYTRPEAADIDADRFPPRNRRASVMSAGGGDMETGPVAFGQQNARSYLHNSAHYSGGETLLYNSIFSYQTDGGGGGGGTDPTAGWPHYSSVGVREQTAELATIALVDAGACNSPRVPLAARPLLDDSDVSALRLGDRQILAGRSTAHARDLYEPAGSYMRPPTSQLTHLLRKDQGSGAANVHEADSLTERDPLLPKQYATGAELHNGGQEETREDLESQGWQNSLRAGGSALPWAKDSGRLRWPKLSAREVWVKGVVEPATFLPAVLLGLLLNVLDGLSYGRWCLVSLTRPLVPTH